MHVLVVYFAMIALIAMYRFVPLFHFFTLRNHFFKHYCYCLRNNFVECLTVLLVINEINLRIK